MHPKSRIDPDRVFVDARNLLVRSAGYRFDLQEREAQWRIHYAVDADMLVTHILPSANTQHGRLFGADDHLAEQVVRLTTEFILRNLISGPASQDDPGLLLVISPHDDELYRRLMRIQSDFYTHVTSESNDGHVKLIRELITSSKTDKDVATNLLEHAWEFMRSVSAFVGPLTAVKRFADFHPNRLLNLQRYEELQSDGSRFRFPSVPTDPRTADFQTYSDSLKDWKVALTRHQGRKSPEALHNDALVLATLDWVNAAVAPLKRRIVLVTGSQNILAAVEDRFPASPDSEEPSFETRFIRHPQAFLCDKRFFSVSPRESTAGVEAGLDTNGSFKVIEWLNVFLPKFFRPRATGGLKTEDMNAELPTSPERWLRALNLANTEFAVDREFEEEVRTLIEEWRDQVGHVTVSRGFRSQSAADIIAQMRNSAKPDWTDEDVRNYLTGLARESLVSLFLSSAILGVLAIRTEENRIRGVPALRFDEMYGRAQRVCSDMQNVMFRGGSDLDVQALYKDMSPDDPDGYHALVIYAFAYAIRRHWYATRTFCRMAISVVDAIEPIHQKKRTGREAAYLLSSAYRRIASGENDLALARHYLQEARRREDPGARQDPRFDSEALAIAVTSMTLLRSGTGSASLGSVGAILELGRQLSGALDILLGIETEELPEIRAWVTRQVFYNISVLALMSEVDARNSTAPFRPGLLAVLEKFRGARLAPEGGVFPDEFTDMLYWAMVGLYDEVGKGEKALHELQKFSSHKFGRDAGLFSSFLDLCSERVPLRVAD